MLTQRENLNAVCQYFWELEGRRKEADTALREEGVSEAE
jgi:hypothetical protein